MNPLRTWWYYSVCLSSPPQSVVSSRLVSSLVSRLPGLWEKAVKVNAKSFGQTVLIFISAPLATIFQSFGVEKGVEFSSSSVTCRFSLVLPAEKVIL